ncbi:hypothetical protein, partial [Pelagibius marinus]|uniref:hypothetical protein n=1 Tax=Pelagibius marinus TaxID=2762760 RepID=UPI001D03B378
EAQPSFGQIRPERGRLVRSTSREARNGTEHLVPEEAGIATRRTISVPALKAPRLAARQPCDGIQLSRL